MSEHDESVHMSEKQASILGTMSIIAKCDQLEQDEMLKNTRGLAMHSGDEDAEEDGMQEIVSLTKILKEATEIQDALSMINKSAEDMFETEHLARSLAEELQVRFFCITSDR
jgi:hypothetical protein